MQIKTVLIFIAVTIGVLLGVGGLLWQFGTNADKPIADVAGEMRYQKGSGETIVTEFSDFQCPACRDYAAPVKQVLAKFEGKVKLVYRHFPLVSIHKNAMVAAQAGEAAYLQGKFWELHDLLFDKQDEWKGLSDPREMFGSYAEILQMDRVKFLSDLDSQEVKDKVSVDVLDSTRYRLTGTPTFFVNGKKTEFAQLESRLTELTK